MKIDKLLRNNIRKLTPYSSARTEYRGGDAVFLDANENPYNPPFNRYPDPLQNDLKSKISSLRNIPVENLFLGNGSDEAIDLIFRSFCEPGRDNVISLVPSYGMYTVCADINDVAVKTVSLAPKFRFDKQAVLNAIDRHTKAVFICSPNNPTGNLFNEADVLEVAESFDGLMVVDEAYIDFSGSRGFLPFLERYSNMVVLQTFSKAWALAGIRLGMAFADPEIIRVMTKVKYPYNVSALTQQMAMKALNESGERNRWIETIREQRIRIEEALKGFEFVEEVFPSDANFILVRVNDPDRVYQYLLNRKVVVRNRSKLPMCAGCLRITVGNENENGLFLKHLEAYGREFDKSN